MRIRVRARAAAVADALRIPALFFALRAHLNAQVLAVVNYHRVVQPSAAREFDEGTADATPDTLNAHLQTLRQHFTPVRMTDLLAFVREGARLPPNAALVTFDDGYRECLDVALPLLQRHGVPGVFFIATDYVSRRRVFWWDRLSWLLKNSRTRQFRLTYPEPLLVDVRNGAQGANRALARLVKTRLKLDLERFLAGVAEGCGIQWDEKVAEEMAGRLVLTWDHVRELRSAGMEVGSHTRTHRVLQTLDPSELEDELTGSRHELERQLGEPVTALAYPVGYPVEAAYLRDAVRRAGYEIAFSYGTGLQRLRSMDPLNVRRLSVEATWGADRLRSVLAIPSLS